MLAAKANDAALVARLIREGGNVNAKDSIQDSAFLYAGAEGFNEILRLTLANGGQTRLDRDAGGYPAEQRRAGQQDVVRQLLDGGADPDIRGPQGKTAVENAERLGFAETAGLIRARG